MSYNMEDSDTTKSRLGARGVVAILGGILALVPVGAYYALGNYSPYIVSYLRNRTDDTELRNVDSLWIGTVFSVTQCVGVTIGGLMDRVIGTKIAIGIGSLIYSGTVLVSYFFVKMSFVSLVLSFGCVNAIGAKVVYGLSVQTAMKWMPHRSSMAAGVVLSGYGAGALVFNQLITIFINPDNLNPDLETEDGERYFTDPELLDRVPLSFVYLGALFLAMQVIGTIMFTSPSVKTETIRTIGLEQTDSQSAESKEDKKLSTISETVKDTYDTTLEVTSSGTTIYNNNNNNNNNDGDKASKEKTSEKYQGSAKRASVKELVLGVLKSRSFYVVWFTVLCFNWALRMVTSLYKSYGQTFIHDDQFLALSGTLSSVFNSVGRPLWGMVMDKYGFRVSIRCISVGFTVICATLFLTEHMHKAAFMVWMCAIMAMYSGIWAICPAAFAKLYGVENTAINYGYIFVASSVASIATLVLGTTLKDIIGYHGIFFIGAGLGAIPFPLTFLFNGVDGEGKRV